MKKILFIAAILCAALSCSKNQPDNYNSPASFEASFESATKSYLTIDRTQVWSGKEDITVYDVDNDGINSSTVFSNATTAGGATARFVSDDPEFAFQQNHYYVALYNCSNVTISNGVIYFTKRQPSQTNTVFVNPESSFYKYKFCMGEGASPLCCMFKYADPNSLQNLTFKNLGALLILRVTNNTGEDISFGCIKLTQTNNTSNSLFRIFGGVKLPGLIEDNIDNSNYNFISQNRRNNIAFRSSGALSLVNGSSRDIGVIVYVPEDTEADYDLTADFYSSIFDNMGEDEDPIYSVTKSHLTGTSFSRCDTKVWNISINPVTKSNVSIEALGDNNQTF